MDGIRAPLENLRRLRALSSFSPSDGSNIVWALRGVSLEVRRGEVVGIIGRNGAGKSTLLKILSRITEPTAGRAEVYGRVGSLLEVGTGFHPELTGRANVYLNGALLGMDRPYIRHRFDDIVAFAGVERFIDTPVKRYSSGMSLRLAFAVAAHLEPEIIMVDEVLAVGDAEFQKKCLGKMQEVSAEGRTVLFVSHNMNAVQRLCSRAVALEDGQIVADGLPADVVAASLSPIGETTAGVWIDVSRAHRKGTGRARFDAVWFSSLEPGSAGRPYTGGALEVHVAIVSDAPRTVGGLAVIIFDRHGTKLVNAHTEQTGQMVKLREGRNVVRSRIDQVLLNPGAYVLGLWVADPFGEMFDYVEAACDIEVAERPAGPVLGRVRDDGAVPCRFEVLDVS